MAEVCVQIPVENIAGMIKGMNENELETLCVLLSEQGQELLKRKNEIISGKYQLLSRDEIFDV